MRIAFALIALAGATAGFAATPAAAQTANTRILTIYGKDPCPTSSNNEEIVICRRLPEEERFRIPLDIREPTASPDSTAGAVRNARIVDGTAEATGVGSCSTVGPGGGSGCFLQNARRARQEKNDKGQKTGVRF